MWGALLQRLINAAFSYVVMPFLSKAVVMLVKYFQDKKEEAERNAKIDEAVKRYEDAIDDQSKRDAFRDLIRSRS